MLNVYFILEIYNKLEVVLQQTGRKLTIYWR